MKRYLPIVIIVAVLAAALVGAIVLVRERQSATGTAMGVTSSTIAKPANADSNAGSNTNVVAVTVEEFGDYQCPPCGHLHPELKKIETDYGNRVRFVFRNLPLTALHKNALLAAQAAEAARLQDRFEQMHDRLYEKQAEWTDEENPRGTFIRYAGELGLNTDRFDRDMDGGTVKQRLSEDQRLADSVGVRGTPTVFVEGQEMKSEHTNGDGIRRGIDYMLRMRGGGKPSPDQR
jgi:protein-disulfide isomerase